MTVRRSDEQAGFWLERCWHTASLTRLLPRPLSSSRRAPVRALAPQWSEAARQLLPLARPGDATAAQRWRTRTYAGRGLVEAACKLHTVSYL